MDLGDTVTNDLAGRLNIVETASVFSQEPGLVVNGQLAFFHGLDGPPDVVSVVVVDVGGPGEDVPIVVGQARRRGFVTLKAGDAMLEESLAGQLLQRRQVAVIPVEPVDLVAFIQEEAQPGG